MRAKPAWESSPGWSNIWSINEFRSWYIYTYLYFLGIFSVTSQIFFTFLNNVCRLSFVDIILFSFILFGDFLGYELNKNTHIITTSAYYRNIGYCIFKFILFLGVLRIFWTLLEHVFLKIIKKLCSLTKIIFFDFRALSSELTFL